MDRSWKRWLPSLPVCVVWLSIAGALCAWHVSSATPTFDEKKYSADDVLLMELNGDLVRTEDGKLIFNESKLQSFPGPLKVVEKCRAEFSDPFHKHGANDHGIGWLVLYTLARFSIGFIAASIVAIVIGAAIGSSPAWFKALNPIIQVLKTVSPVSWLPILLYSVKDGWWTGIAIVFLASLWPTIANTAFGVSNMRREFHQVAAMLELSWWRRLTGVILPATAPTIVAGLRISFGSALIAVVPAEMLLGQLGVGYLILTFWNNLDLPGVIFSILVAGFVGVMLDLLFQRTARVVSYAE